MGTWNNHGMVDDEEDQILAVSLLGMSAEELTVLADHNEKEQWIWEQMRKRTAGQHKRKHSLIAGYFQKRALRLKELAALVKAEEDFEIQSTSEKPLLYCTHCGRVYTSRGGLDSHLRNKHPEHAPAKRNISP